MLVKPQVSDARIIDALRSHYRIDVKELEFLPIGNDAKAWAYRVSGDASAHFLKLRRGSPNLAGLLASAHLHRSGLKNVVAPLQTLAGDLQAPLGDYTLALYRWVCGESAWKRELTPRQYRQWGRAMRAIHNTAITPQLSQHLPKETYDAKWLKRLQAVESALARPAARDTVARRMIEAWQEKSAQIELAKKRYMELTRGFAARSAATVLCHADIHAANILIDRDGAIHIVDWDEVVIAPKERDLMFFIDDGASEAAAANFLDGYGNCAVDEIGLAYYRYDWLMQEFCENGERVFLDSTLSAADREQALSEFRRLFAPGDVLERARRACQALQ